MRPGPITDPAMERRHVEGVCDACDDHVPESTLVVWGTWRLCDGCDGFYSRHVGSADRLLASTLV